jgi:hypothetical protein
MREFHLFAALLALGLPPASAEAAAPARWTALADCAAAYQANARLADPHRPASMTAQIADVASDYAKAAAHAYRQQAGRTAPHATHVVDARIATKASSFGGRPREEVERFIDACPQIEN